MSTTKSERVAQEALQTYRDGDLRGCIHQLVDYADRHVNNAKTAYIFKQAIDAELSKTEPDISPPDTDAPPCTHCGSNLTWWRSDGDAACNDCPGIMPHPPQDEEGDPQ